MKEVPLLAGAGYAVGVAFIRRVVTSVAVRDRSNGFARRRRCRLYSRRGHIRYSSRPSVCRGPCLHCATGVAGRDGRRGRLGCGIAIIVGAARVMGLILCTHGPEG